jgi:hypothetical protein
MDFQFHIGRKISCPVKRLSVSDKELCPLELDGNCHHNRCDTKNKVAATSKVKVSYRQAIGREVDMTVTVKQLQVKELSWRFAVRCLHEIQLLETEINKAVR